ncbi:MAG TPA: AsmA-like C-terminal region-containing protein, partial [Candidatus Binatia bacterium]|nr:AsmA-like C-terminal region-containing protein [Candidatus Binatia bacterium]
MSKKSISLALGAVIFAAVALVYCVNLLVATRRDLVYEELQRFAGKDVAFDEFEVTLLTGLGFSAKEFRIADSPVFAATPLLRAKELRMGVSLLSLMLGRIVINKLTFIEPEFQIITNEEGVINISSLEDRRKQLADLPKARSSAAKRELSSVNFVVTNFQIKNGRIDFIDRSVRAPAEMQIKRVDINLQGINPNGRAKMTLAASLSESLGQDVRVAGYLGPFARGKGWKEQPVEVNVEFDSLFVPLLTRAVPFFRDKIPPELDIAGPLSLRAKLAGVLARPQVLDFIVKAPILGSLDYNAVLNGSADLSANGLWSEAQLKGNLRLSSIDITRLQGTSMLQDLLPIALSGDGEVSVESLIEGTWNRLRLGTIVRARNSEIRYGTWLRKPRGTAAEWSSKISRQDNRFVIHESVLTLGSTRTNLSGVYEYGSRARLQLRARADQSDLSQVLQFFPALQAFRATGNLHGEILASKVMIGDSSWTMNGKLEISEAELRNENSRRKLERLSASLLLLGKHARIENAAFRVRSSDIAMTGAVADLATPTLTCELRSANLHLADLADFPVAKSDRLQNVRLSGKLTLEDGTPRMRGTVSSSGGTLHDVPYLDLRSAIAWSAAEINLRDLSFRALNGIWRSREVSITETGKSQRLELSSQLTSVDLTALLTSKLPASKDRIEGQLNFQGEFSAEAHNGGMKPDSLQGSGETRIQGGTLKNFNLIALMISRIGSSGSPISLQLSPSLAELAKSKDTRFENIEALIILDQEVIRTEDLQLTTADYRIKAAGWMMLDQVTRWNGMLVLSLRISQELLRETKSLRYLIDRSGQINLPFRAEGTLANLRVRPDTRIIAQIVRRGSLPKTIEPPPIDKRPEAQE